MSSPEKADPTMYRKMRDHMLRFKQPGFEPGAVQKVLMDWHVGNGKATILAAADGSASVYLSSGGGYLGGGQGHPEVREAAFRAIRLAERLMTQFIKTESFELPAHGSVSFFVTTNESIYTVVESQAELRYGESPFAALGNAMQAIATGYRLRQQEASAKI
jgi:hypothetical protein